MSLSREESHGFVLLWCNVCHREVSNDPSHGACPTIVARARRWKALAKSYRARLPRGLENWLPWDSFRQEMERLVAENARLRAVVEAATVVAQGPHRDDCIISPGPCICGLEALETALKETP